MNKYIFILAQHRTGSTLLKNILDKNTEVSMATDEMNLYEPFRKNTLDRLIQNRTIETTEDFVRAVENEIIYGTFWKDLKKENILFKKVQNELHSSNNPINSKKILKAILDVSAQQTRSKYAGIKYPIHLKRVKILKEWFPESKIIFLTRNPKAIIASKLNDPATRRRKEQSVLKRLITHYITLFYFCYEFNASAKVFKKNGKFIYKISYEEVITNQNSIEKLCDFIGITFAKEMLLAKGKPSSYPVQGEQVATASKDKYKTILTPFDQWLIRFLTKKTYQFLKSPS